MRCLKIFGKQIQLIWDNYLIKIEVLNTNYV